MEFLGFSKVQNDDIEELAALGAKIWREHYQDIINEEQINYMLDKFQSQNAIKNQLKEGYEYYFIKQDSISIGYFGIQKRLDNLFLSKFYIQKESRRNGFGRRTFEFIKQKCLSYGLNKITLTVNKYNNSSIKAYEKMGFKKTDSVVCDIGDGFVMDDYIYTYFMS